VESLFSCHQVSADEAGGWNKLLEQALYPSYRASMPFQFVEREVDQEIVSFLFRYRDQDVAGAHYSLKRSFAGIISTSDIQSGIMFTSNPDSELVNYILDHFAGWSVRKKASYLRISPWLPAVTGDGRTEYHELLENALLKRGFRVIAPGRSTYWLDLTWTEEDMLSAMRPKTRYDIKHGIRSGLECQRIDRPENHIISNFWDMYSRLGTKKNFSILPERKFRDTVITLLNAGLASLFITSFKGRTVNISMASRTGIASYMFGAADPEFKNINGCPPPGNFAQWEMIRTMKSLGLKVYDMGFCPGAVPYTEHPSYDIWRFKFGFGGKHVQFMPTYGKVLKPVSGRIFQYLRYKK